MRGVGRTQRSIKELQGRVEEMEEELEAERQSRSKADRQKADLSREYDELTERLDESCVTTAAQIELNKKRESEIMKMRKKHQDAVAEMSEQCEQLNKIKAKMEKDKVAVKMQLDDSKAATDHVTHEKAVAEKNLKALHSQLQSFMKKIEESTIVLGEYEGANKRLMSENSNLYSKLEDLLNSVSMLQKIKITLNSQLDDAKRMCDDEAKERQSLLGRFRTLEHEYDGVKEHFEDELQQKTEAGRQLQKLMADSNMWRCKYENDALAKIEELEMTKLKLQARLAENESTMENLNSKLVALEKSKMVTQKDIEEMAHRVDQVNIMYNQAEKRVKLMDKVIAEWKTKADSTSLELNNSQKECRNASAELFRVKNGYDEAASQLDDVRRENRSLSDEIKDLMEQISEGGRSIHEIEKQRKRLEAEKNELEGALGDAETALETEENKFLRLSLEINQVRSDIEKRLQEKEEEFECTRRNHAKAMEQMQYAIEQESKSKAEAMRMRKKLELDITELDSALDHANLANAELQKSIKLYQERIREKTLQFESEQQAKDAAKDYMLNAERRAHSAQNAVEETKTMLEQADRSRKQAEQDLCDTNEQLADLTCQNQGLSSAKRKLESDLTDLKGEGDEANAESKCAEDRARKFMLDAAKLAEELRSEQEHTQGLEKDRREQEAMAKDLQVQLDDAETNAIKWGRKMVAKMESRCRELEAELDSEQRRCGDAHKNFRKAERGIKEYTFKSDEDRKNAERMQDLVEKLQQQIKTYKKQIEEAEEIAAINLTKFRKAQLDLADTTERADLTEQAWAKYKARDRSQSIARDY